MRPDLSLLRAYNSDFLSEGPFEQPLIIHYFNDDKHLVYIAVKHATGLASETFRSINAAFAIRNPDFVIVEGTPTHEGIVPRRHTQLAHEAAGNNFEGYYESVF